MNRSILVVVDGSSAGLHPRAFAAPALAQRIVGEASGDADLLILGAAKAPAGRWRRCLRADLADGQAVTEALSCLIEKNEYAAVAFGDSPTGREMAGRLGVSAALPVVGCTQALRFTADGLEVTRPAEAGKRTARLTVADSPALLLVDPDSSASGTATGEAPAAETLAVAPRTAAFERTGDERLGPWELDVAESDVVVAGGRGVGGPDGFEMLVELATLLEGAIGASRVAVDLGWAPRTAQVGLTGKTVSPRLYVACGISGAIHHTLGMRESSFIVVINSDAQAPILKIANASIIGDVRQVVPKLISELKGRRPAGALAAAVAAGGS